VRLIDPGDIRDEVGLGDAELRQCGLDFERRPVVWVMVLLLPSRSLRSYSPGATGGNCAVTMLLATASVVVVDANRACRIQQFRGDGRPRLDPVTVTETSRLVGSRLTPVAVVVGVGGGALHTTVALPSTASA